MTTIHYEVYGDTNAGISWSPGQPSGVTASYSNGDFTISGTPTQIGTYTYTITPSGGCAAATATGTIIVTTTTTWTGAVSTDWHNAANWDACVPSGSHDAVIPGNVTNYPIISSSAQTKNLTVNSGSALTISGTNTLSIAGNFVNNGSFTSNNSTVIYNGAVQTVGVADYHHLTLSGSGTKTMTGVGTINGNFTMSGNNTTTAATTVTLNVAGNLTVSAGNTLTLTNANPALILTGNADISGLVTSPGAGKTIGGDLTINSGGSWTEQASPAYSIGGNFTNNGTFTGGGGTYTLSGADKTIGGSSTISLNAVTLTGSYTNTGILTVLNNINNSGTLTQGTSATLNLGGSFGASTTLNASASGNTVNYTNVTGGSTVKSATYHNLTLSNTSGTNTAGGNITVNGTLTTTAGGTLDMSSYTLDGTLSGISNAGILKTAATGATPIPASKTWGGIVEFYANDAQTIPGGTFQNLTVTDTNVSGNYLKSASEGVTVNGILTLGVDNSIAGHFDASKGALDIPTGFLDLGVSATVTGPGNITGVVRRSHLFTQNGTNLLTFTGANQGLVLFELPDQTDNPLTFYIKATTGAPISTTGCTMENTPNPISRYYTIWKSGSNWGSTRSSFRHYYLDSELNGASESTLSVWKKTSDGGACETIVELGKSNLNTETNFVGIARQLVTEFISDTEGNTQIFAAPTAISTLTWNGLVSVTMTTADNWTPQGVPSANVNLIIPGEDSYGNTATLPSNAEFVCKSIQIQDNGVLTAGTNSTLRLKGSNAVFIKGSNATFNQGNSTLIIDSNAESSIPGTVTLNNITVNSGSQLLIPGEASLTVGGTFTNNGTIIANTPNTIVTFSGTNQTIPNTDTGLAEYNNIQITGSGTIVPNNISLDGNLSISGVNTILPANVTVKGNFSYTGSGLSSSGTTLIMDGTATQSINDNALTLSGLTVNNTDAETPGVILNTSLTLTDNLTFTNGTVVTGANTLTIGAGGSITGAGLGKYVSGNLRRYVPDTDNPSLTWEVGHDNAYSPVTLAFSGSVSGSGYIDISSTQAAPSVASGLSQTNYINRKWVVSNTDVSFTSVNPTFTFAASNIQNSADPNLLVVRKLSGATWSALSTGTRTATSTQATGVTAFSEFYIGEPAALEVSSHPSDASVCEGTTNVQFTSLSSSEPQTTIQWFRDAGLGFVAIDDQMDGGIYSGYQGSTLTISSASFDLHNYQYKAVFTNINGEVSGNAATLTVYATSVGGSVSAVPTTICTGGSSTLTLTGNTGNILRWEVSDDNGTSWDPISHTDAEYNATDIQATSQYRAVVQNGSCAESNSTPATVNTDPATVAGTITGASTACTGTNSTTLTLGGNIGSILDWEYSTDGSLWTPLNHTQSTYTAQDLTVTTQYRVIVQSGVCGTEYTEPVSIIVSPLSVAGTAAAEASEICGGTTTIINLTGSTGTIQWQQSSDDINWQNVTEGGGQTTASLTTPALTAPTYFRAAVTSGACSVEYSNSEYINISAGSAGVISGATTVCSGNNSTTLTLSGNSGGLESIVSWQVSDDNENWDPISNTTGQASITIENLTATTYYRVDVNVSGCGEVFTAPAIIQVDPVSAAGAASVNDNTLCIGENAVLSLASYIGDIQWQETLVENPAENDWSNVTSGSGGDSDEYTTPSLSTTTYYRAVVTSGVCASETSSVLTITVNDLPEAPIADNTNNPYTGSLQTAGATAPTGSTIAWYNASTGGSITSAPSATVAGTYTAWAASQADITGCESATRTEVTLTITPVALTVTADDKSKTYDGLAFTGFTSAISGFVNNDNESVISGSISYIVSPATAVPAGTYAITPDVSSLSATNYTFTGIDGTLTINTKELTIADLTAEDKAYDGNTTATVTGTPLLTGIVGSDDVQLTGTPVYNFASADVATNINVNISGFSISGADAANYTLTLPVLSASITLKEVIVTALNRNKTYGGTETTSGEIDTHFSATGLVGSDAISSATLSYSGSPAGNLAEAQIGDYTVTIADAVFTSGSSANYSLTYNNGILTVVPAPLTVTAADQNKIYGQTVPTTGDLTTHFTVSGLQNSDAVGTATLGYSGSPAGNLANADAGSYVITPSALIFTSGVTNNYDITYVTATLTIYTASLTVTALPQNKEYGQISETTGILDTHFSVSGLQASDVVSGVTLQYEGTPSGNLSSAGPGSYSITPSDISFSTGSANNYSITYTANTLTIGAANLVITANDAIKTYGQSLSSGDGSDAFTATGLQNGETIGSVTIAYGNGALLTDAVGTYTDQVIISAPVGGTFIEAYYNISFVAGDIQVQEASLTITANNLLKCFGETYTFSGTEFTSIGLLNGDDISSVSLSSVGAGSGASPDSYDIVISALVGTGLANYNITYQNGTLTVDASAPTFIVAPAGSYDPFVEMTYTTESGKSNYQWTLSGDPGADYEIVSGGTGNTDYTVTVYWKSGGEKTVTVNYDNENGCPGANAASTTITINATVTFRYSAMNGNWNSASTWSATPGGSGGDGIPGAGSYVIIMPNHTVTVNQNTGNLARLEISSGAQLTVAANFTVSAATTVLNGYYLNNSTGAFTPGSMTVGDGATYQHNINGGTIPSATWDSNSTCDISGTTGNAPANAGGQSYGNLIFRGAVSANLILFGSTSTEIKGDFTVQGNATGGRLDLSSTGLNLTINGDFNCSFNREFNLTRGGTFSYLTVNGNLNITNTGTAVFDFMRGTSGGVGGVITLNGNFNQTSGTVRSSNTPSTIYFNGNNATFNQSGGTFGALTNFEVSKNADLKLLSNFSISTSQSLVVNGLLDCGVFSVTGVGGFTINKDGTLISGSPDGIVASTTSNLGNVTTTGSRTFSLGANYVFNGTSNQVTGSGLTQNTPGNITIDNPGNTVTLSAATNMTGSLTVVGGSTLALANNNLGATSAPTAVNLNSGAAGSAISSTGGTLTLNGDITVTDGGLGNGSNGALIAAPVNLGSTTRTVTADATGASTDLTISGIVSGTGGLYKAGLGVLELSGANTYSGGTTLNAGQITINNASALGSGNLTISGATTIDNTSGSAITLSSNPGIALNADLTFGGSNSLNLGTGTINMGANRTITTQGSTLTLGGTLSAANYNITKNGAGTLAFGSNAITINSLAINAGSFTSTSGALTISGSFTNSGTFNHNTGTVDFSGSGAQTIPALNYHNLTSSSTGVRTLASSGTIGISGAWTMGSNSYTSIGSTIDFNGSGAQNIPAFNYHNLTSSSSGARTLPSTGTVVISGVFTPGTNSYTTTGSTLDFNGSSSQTIPAFNYNNLTSSSSGARTLASSNVIGVAGTFTPGTNSYTITGSTIDFNGTGAQSIPVFNYHNLTSSSSGARTLPSSGIVGISGAFTPGTNAYTVAGSTLDFNGSSNQDVPLFTYHHLSLTGNTTKTLAGNITIGGNLTNNAGTDFSAGNNSISLAGNWSNSGIFTPGTSTVTFNGSGDNQAITGTNTFYNLIIDRASGEVSAVGSTLAVSGLAHIQSGTFKSATQYNDVQIDNGATLECPPSGSIEVSGDWTNNGTFTHNSGTVTFSGTAAQTLGGSSVTTFHNLTLSNTTAGVNAGNDITVEGTLNLGANPSSDRGQLEMTIDYGDYATGVYEGNGATPATAIKDNTSSYNNLNSYILSMGPSSTTTGTGDVTGKIRRTSISADQTYSFGNEHTTVRFSANGGTIPSAVTVVSTIGSEGTHVDKTNAVQRLYQILKTGGASPARMTLTLAYQDGELNGNTEGDLVTWDHHIPYGGATPHEHGKTGNNTTSNFVELAEHGVSYLATEGDTEFTKYWMISGKLSTDTIWLGAVPTGSWTSASNWTSGVVPGVSTRVVIPDAATTAYDPQLSGSITTGAIEIKSGGIVNGNDATLTLTRGPSINLGAGTWENAGTFNPGTSTVVFDYEQATVSGNTQFYNVTVNTAKTLKPQEDNVMAISGVLTLNGTLDAATSNNTINFNASNGGQTIPAITYSNLTMGNTSGTQTAAGQITANNTLTITSGGTMSLSDYDAAAGSLTGGGNISLGSATLTVGSDNTSPAAYSGVISGTGSLIKNGSGALGLSGASEYIGGTTLNAGLLNIGNAAAIGSGSLTIGGTASIDNISGSSLSLNGNPTIALNGNLSFVGTHSLDLGSGTITMDGDRTVTTAANTLTLGGGFDASSHSLTKAGAGTLEFGSNAINLNSITINAGSLTSTSGILTLAGNFTNNGTFTHNSGTVAFAGAATQTLSGSTSFHQLSLNNINGLELASDISVVNTLAFTAGKIVTNGQLLAIGSESTSGTITGVGATSYVNGTLRRYVPTASSPEVQYPVGDALQYSPVAVAFSGTIDQAGYLDVSTAVPGSSPPYASGLSQTKYVNRKWTVTNTGVTGFDSYAPTFGFGAGDIVGGADYTKLTVRRLSGGTWTAHTNGIRTTTSTQATGLTAFSDYYVGEPGELPSILTHPASTTVCYNASTSFTSTASSGLSMTSEWERSADTGSSWSTVSLSTLDSPNVTYADMDQNTLQLSAALSGINQYQYRRSYTNINGTVTSDAAVLTVNPELTATSENTEDPCQTGAAEITVQVSGGTSPYSITACGTYTAPHPNAGQELNSITDPTRTGVTTNQTFSGLPGNATYRFIIKDVNNCPPN